MLSRISRVQLCCTMDCGLPAPLSKGFPRPEYWHGLPCSPLTQGSNLVSYISCNGRTVLYHLRHLGNPYIYMPYLQ